MGLAKLMRLRRKRPARDRPATPVSDLDAQGAPEAPPRRFALTLTVIFGLLLVTTVAGRLSGTTAHSDTSVDFLDFPLVAAFSFTLVGGLVVPRQPRNPVGWLLVAIGFSSAFTVLASSFSRYHLMAWISICAPAVAYGLLPLALLLFPEGRLPSRPWRSAIWAAVACLIILVMSVSVAAWDDPYLQSRAVTTLWFNRASLLGVTLCIIAAIASLVMRWRHAEGDTRQQLKWLGLGAAFIPLTIALELLDVPWAWIPLATTVPAAMAVSILKYRLYDIDLFLNRSIVYATLTLLVVGVYVGVVTLLEIAFSTGAELATSTAFTTGARWQQAVAVGAIAMLFGPLQEKVQRGVNRLLYGHRDEPYKVVSQLSHRLEQAMDPAAVLPQVVETITDSLQLPYVAIELTYGAAEGQRLVTSHGRRAGEPEAFAMAYQGQVVGRLLASPRSAAQPFTAAERSLLEDLARQAGLAAHVVSLTADLQRSRERLVRSREEERRRLRRDLHDGLGPTLAGMTLQVGAARALLTVNLDQAECVLGELEQQLQSCIREVRQLVDNLHPSTLDHLGLIGAIRYHISAFTSGSGDSGTKITLNASDDLGELPAAVEVAAYRIVTEAITNTVRHAAASSCIVALTFESGLLVEVIDNGVGLPDHYQAGIGLTSMRERTEELGGTFTAQHLPGGGSRIRALLPLVVA
ncbi:MAG: sensor histidine kinase [Pseudonocardiaceae bacterium]